MLIFTIHCIPYTFVCVCVCVLTVKCWNSITFDGSWRGSTAGGCCNFVKSFANNPQYAVNLTEDADGDGKCTALIALIQINRRKQKNLGMQDLSVGFSVYKVLI